MYGQRIKEVMERERMLTAAPHTSVADAARMMAEQTVSAVLVLDGPRLAGIFTERDVLVRVVGERRDPATLRVREVMTTKLFTVEPTTTVEQALALMSKVPCRHLPVVEDGRLLRMVSARNALGLEIHQFEKELKERDHIAEIL